VCKTSVFSHSFRLGVFILRAYKPQRIVHIKDKGLDSDILFSFIFSVGFYERFPEYMFPWDGAVKHLPFRDSHIGGLDKLIPAMTP